MKRMMILVMGLALVSCRKVETNPPPAPKPVPAAAVTPPDNGAPTANELEVEYLSTNDLYGKLQIMEDLTDTPPAAALDVIGRLFYYEEDPAVREQLLRTMMDVDGPTVAKRKLLEEAIQPDIPLSVRLAAIDMLDDLGDKRARPALQKLRADPNQEVRDAADDALHDLM